MLAVTRLQCPACGTEVAGHFGSGRMVNVAEPHASLLELFLRARGNMKELERELGLSYPTVRSRLEKALIAAGLGEAPASNADRAEAAAQRVAILEELEQGAITAAEAAARLRELQKGRFT